VARRRLRHRRWNIRAHRNGGQENRRSRRGLVLRRVRSLRHAFRLLLHRVCRRDPRCRCVTHSFTAYSASDVLVRVLIGFVVFFIRVTNKLLGKREVNYVLGEIIILLLYYILLNETL